MTLPNSIQSAIHGSNGPVIPQTIGLPRPFALLCGIVATIVLCGCGEAVEEPAPGPAQFSAGEVVTQPGQIELAGTGRTLEVTADEKSVVCRVLDQGRAVGAWSFGKADRPWAYYVEARPDGGYFVWLGGSIGVYRPTVTQSEASNLAVAPSDAAYQTMPKAFADAIR